MFILFIVGLFAIIGALFVGSHMLVPDGLKVGPLQIKGVAAGGAGAAIGVLGVALMATYLLTSKAPDGPPRAGSGAAGNANMAPEQRHGVTDQDINDLIWHDPREVDPALRDAFRDVTTTRNAPDARKGLVLSILPDRTTWKDRRTPPAAGEFSLEQWAFTVEKVGELYMAVVKGVAINHTDRDCRTLSLSAYALDSYGQSIGQGGTVVRDVRADDRTGVDFEIRIGGISMDANKKPNADRVVLTPGKAFWVTDY
ncbi:MAG: hypothetical protein AB7S36_09450 [Planctomycetota bacterium]